MSVLLNCLDLEIPDRPFFLPVLTPRVNPIFLHWIVLLLYYIAGLEKKD